MPGSGGETRDVLGDGSLHVVPPDAHLHGVAVEPVRLGPESGVEEREAELVQHEEVGGQQQDGLSVQRHSLRVCQLHLCPLLVEVRQRLPTQQQPHHSGMHCNCHVLAGYPASSDIQPGSLIVDPFNMNIRLL